MTARSALPLLVLVASLMGCGQKGDLYLPDIDAPSGQQDVVAEQDSEDIR